MQTLVLIGFCLLAYVLAVALLVAILFEGGRRLERKDLRRLMGRLESRPEPVSSDEETTTLYLRGASTNADRNL